MPLRSGLPSGVRGARYAGACASTNIGKVKSATSVQTPLLSRGGVAAASIECCEATVDGADGVVLVNRLIFLTSTTPTPPLLRLRAIALALRGLRRGLVLERVINDAPSSRRDLNLVRCKVA